MNLLSLPIEELFFNVVGLFICLAIMVTCVCRLNVMESMPLRLTLEQGMLIAFALWAAGTFVELMQGQLIGFHGAAGGLGITLYLWLSFKHWRLQHALLREARERGGFPHPLESTPHKSKEGNHANTANG